MKVYIERASNWNEDTGNPNNKPIDIEKLESEINEIGDVKWFIYTEDLGELILAIELLEIKVNEKNHKGVVFSCANNQYKILIYDDYIE